MTQVIDVMKNILETFLKTLVEVAEKSEAEISNVITTSIKDLKSGAQVTKETLSRIFEEAKSEFIKIVDECSAMISEERKKLVNGFNEVESALGNMEQRVHRLITSAESGISKIVTDIESKADKAGNEVKDTLTTIAAETKKATAAAQAELDRLIGTISSMASKITSDAESLSKTLFDAIDKEIKKAFKASEELVERIKNAASSAIKLVENKIKEVEGAVTKMTENIEMSLTSASVALKNDIHTVIEDTRGDVGDIEKVAKNLAGPAIIIEAFKRKGPEIAIFAGMSVLFLILMYFMIVKPTVAARNGESIKEEKPGPSESRGPVTNFNTRAGANVARYRSH
jgi:hypothetical protein